MKTLGPDLEAHLASGATTLCWCWKLTRRDGVVQGFTDHDRTLSFEGVDFEAEAGFEAGEVSERVGLSVDNLDVAGAITSERLSEQDLGNGLYDDARIEIYRVNWQAPEQRVLMRAGSIGEVRRAGKAFAAEIRGISHYLQQPKGRLYQFACDTDLGSAKCGIDVSLAVYRTTAMVADVGALSEVRVSFAGTFEEGWFTRGLARVLSGAVLPFTSEIRRHAERDDGTWITFWAEPAVALAVGDTLELTAGCDKHFETCRDRFANTANFRGFPHLPGNDFVTRIARRSKS